jgi:hypothetical protein
MGQAKLRAPSHCYLCGKHLTAPINVDHVPPKLFFPEELRKGLNLLTIPAHVACNEAWRMDEEYFIHTLLPFAERRAVTPPSGSHSANSGMVVMSRSST